MLLFYAQESPYFLMSKRRYAEAKVVVKNLNGNADNINDEIIRDIEKYIQDDTSLEFKPPLMHSQTNNIPECDEEEVLYSQDLPIVSTSKEKEMKNSKFEQKLSYAIESEECCGCSHYFTPALIKIVMIMAGLFLFTRLCGKLRYIFYQ